MGFDFFLLPKLIFLLAAADPAFSASNCALTGLSVRTVVSLLFLPFVVCFLGPAFGYGRMDTGENVASAEDDGSSHGVTGEDATVATSVDGVGLVEVDGTSGVTAGIGWSVTRDGAKSLSLKMSLLEGQIPVHPNPA